MLEGPDTILLLVSESILYPYGEELGDLPNPRLDDGSSPEIIIPVNFTFFGQTYRNIYVNNNGHLSFNRSSNHYTPMPFPATQMPPLVAPFWADINNKRHGNIMHRQSQEPELLELVTSHINSSFPYLKFQAGWAFVATYDRVRYYGSNSSKENTFQAALTTDGNLSFIIFNYGHMEWTTGTSAGGDRLTGLGGTPALAGLNGGASNQYYNIPGSMSDDILHIGSTSNVGTPGRWIFRVDYLFLPNGCIHNNSFLPHATIFWNSSRCDIQCQCTVRSDIVCVPQQCAPHESCKPIQSYHICLPASEKTCTVSGNLHCTTFDRRFLHLTGSSSYVLAQLCGDSAHLTPFTVTVKMGESKLTSQPWPRLVTVMVYEHEITLPTERSGYVLVNGIQSLTPVNLSDSKIRVSQGGFAMLIKTDFELSVSFDGLYHVTITVPHEYFNFTCGLCGTPNKDPTDDLRMRNGSQAVSHQDFAESWRVSQHSQRDPAVSMCTNGKEQLYSSNAYCGVITDSNGPFSSCMMYMPYRSVLESCVNELCASNGSQEVLCLVLSSYVDRCQAANIKIRNWRKEGFCGLTCPVNSSYALCDTACPASCLDPNAPNACAQPCKESCVCNPSLVLSGGACVPLESCGCTLEGHYYRLGDDVLLEDHCSRKCSCREASSAMACEEHACGTYEKCSVEDAVRKCRPAPNGTCQVWGDPHYHTYDGLTYLYQGICRYTLTKSCGRVGPLAEFSVEVENVRRTSNVVSWTHLVEVRAYGHRISISEAHKGDVQVNGTVSHLPLSLYSGKLLIYRNGPAAVVQAAFGISVSFDWHEHLVVNISGAYSGAVCGLCGDFNGDPTDDYRDPSGLVMGDTVSFVESWQDPGYTSICAVTKRVPGCGMETVSRYFSARYCGIITDSGGPFTECNGVLDSGTKLTECVYNMCTAGDSQQAFCGMIEGFAQQCQKRGIIIQHWRNQTQCEMKCRKENTHYELCGTICPVSCSNRRKPSSCPSPCEEGCQCNSGFVLNGTDCIPVEQCGCTYNDSHYRPGDTWRGEDCLTICMCNETTSIAQCSSATCAHEEDCVRIGGVYECQVPPEGNCRASASTHYSAFDGWGSNFQSNCTYILSELCVPSDVLSFFRVEVKAVNWARNQHSATTEVIVWVNGHQISFTKERKESVKVNGVSVTLPASIDGGRLAIYESGQNVVMKALFGLTVNYNPYSVHVSLHSRYRGNTCGLCGNFNGAAGDDMAIQNGSLSNHTSHLDTEWRFEDRPVCSSSCGESCAVCENEDRLNSDSTCRIITDPSGPFTFCHPLIESRPFFSQCMNEDCLSGDDNGALCLAIQTYATACQAANITIGNWRNETSCALACLEHSHYQLCGDPCQDLCASAVVETYCGSACSEGCFCDEGFLRSGDVCVPVAQCGCIHQGRYYKVGDIVWLTSCTQRCHCDLPGTLQCVPATCNPGQHCAVQNGRLGCFSDWTYCAVTGDPHYLTFDGAIVHFQGTCAYEVAHTCLESSNFSFWVKAENRNRRSPKVSFVYRVQVRLRSKDSEINVTLGGFRDAQVNGERTPLPKSLGPLANLTKEGNMVVLSTSKGLEIRYRAGTLFIRVRKEHQGHLCGMCGNFNLNPTDDKVLPTGATSRNDIALGNSWRSDISQERCRDDAVMLPACNLSQSQLEEPCAILTNRSGPFAECHWHEDPSRYRASCDYDLCHHGRVDGMLCAAVACYEEICKLHGVLVSPWRGLLQCPEEDPCESLACTDREWCGERNGEFGCFCFEEYDGQQKDNFDFRMACVGSTSLVSLSRCLLFTDGIHLTSLHLADPQCTGSLLNGRLLFLINSVRRACGTQVQVNMTHASYTNHISIQAEEGAAEISHPVHLPVSCVYPLTINLIPPTSGTPVQAVAGPNFPSGLGRYQTTMLLYQDPDYRQHFTEIPIWLNVTDKVYVGLSISGADPTMYVLTIAACWATKGMDPSSGVRWDLITNQCPNPRDGELVIEEDGVSTIGRFSFSVFQFIFQTRQVYLHCKVQLCRIQEVDCTRPCGRAHVAVTDREEESPVLSIGPLVRLGEQEAPAALHGKGTIPRGRHALFFTPQLLLLHCVFLLLR
ncbi:alpha-tectorin-like isoform X2 [Ambystoma mexicanum]|uniref:alpha-tectorin-like isoform X2 n=1 Tax=Ambystoma mexicanum TaxID=8296 RepID=UPI0037E8A01E